MVRMKAADELGRGALLGPAELDAGDVAAVSALVTRRFGAEAGELLEMLGLVPASRRMRWDASVSRAVPVRGRCGQASTSG